MVRYCGVLLIFSSESSLVDRANSSDGVGSSRSSSIYTSLSSNFQEPQPYKPEFLKYLESSILKEKGGSTLARDI